MNPRLLGMDNPVVATLLANIRFGDAAARTAAVRQAQLVGTAAMPALGAVYAGDDPAGARAACEALKRIVFNAGRPGARGEAEAACGALLRLAAQGNPRAVRADAIQWVGILGGAEEAAVLAGMLADVEVREDARMAMTRIPGKEVDALLLRAARECPADYRAAIDQSIRHRKTTVKQVGIRR